MRDIDIAILSVRVRPQSQISRSCHSLTLNISQMATDTATVTMDGKWETVPKLSKVPFLMTLSNL